MIFDTANWITLIVALLAATPAWVAAYQVWKSKKKSDEVDYQKKLIQLTSVVSQLLALICTYDIIMKNLFIKYPDLNSTSRSDWNDANIKLTKLRKDINEM